MLIALLALILSPACTKRQVRKLVEPDRLNTLDPATLYLKAHMNDGQVYVLDTWTVDEEERRVSGAGTLLDINRRAVDSGDFDFPIDSVALFETNHLSPSPAIGAMSIITAASLGFTIFCIANPKACFGSCPTFYITDGEQPVLQAEGFSASVAPSLEATDIDALFRARPSGSELYVTMTNEALETHVVRKVDLLAASRPFGGRVLCDIDSRFRQIGRFVKPSVCTGPEGDCLALVEAFDDRFRTSEADSTDLATDETLLLEFADVPDGDIGLAIASRQSLMSTYLFYQSLAYLGSQAGKFLAELERQPEFARGKVGGLGQILGGIEIQTRDETGDWVTRGLVRETGPLASDIRLVKIPHPMTDQTSVRLKLKRGYWRIDYLALAEVGREVEPLRIAPAVVELSENMVDTSISSFLDADRYLVTYPGDSVRMTFVLPGPAEEYELFLESTGYYFEWIRDVWLAEEDLSRAAQILFDPAQALKTMAPEFKVVEPEMEETFWNSRYVRDQN